MREREANRAPSFVEQSVGAETVFYVRRQHASGKKSPKRPTGVQEPSMQTKVMSGDRGDPGKVKGMFMFYSSLTARVEHILFLEVRCLHFSCEVV